jgi:hypothetical protein
MIDTAATKLIQGRSKSGAAAGVLEYWPAMFLGERRLDLLSANFGIDWGGRAADCEFQDPITLECVSATYYYLTDEWSLAGWPTDDRLTAVIRQVFAAFDNGNRA